MKTRWAVVGISAVLMIASLVLVRAWKNSHNTKARFSSFAQFNSDYIVPYQDKVKLMTLLMQRHKIKDTQWMLITTHVPQWSAKNQKDIEEILEVSAFIETQFSQHIVLLNELSKTDSWTKEAMGNLRKFDEILNKRLTRLNNRILRSPISELQAT